MKYCENQLNYCSELNLEIKDKSIKQGLAKVHVKRFAVETDKSN